ncbi:MAG: hypothetical protein HY365_02050 [Candidatus Aenigmarchaeota archaeon]|nr:hypothetical protein [Candidatus Aenigmarchaeota archaeon]
MTTVADLIDYYEKAGKTVHYYECTETDAIRYMDEMVTNDRKPVDVNQFGSGRSEHFTLFNYGWRTENGESRSGLFIQKIIHG